MMVNTPFFISPAYSVPRITISLWPNCRLMLVPEVMPGTRALAGKLPALKMT